MKFDQSDTLNLQNTDIGVNERGFIARDKNFQTAVEGVYVVGVTIGKEHLFGMLNVGVRPTVSAEKEVSIEVNIFDFDQDIYGSQIEIDFIKHIRNEIQFDSVNELKLQLEQDLFLCKKILTKV